LGVVDYARALRLQQDLAERRRRGEVPDTLLLLEHPHVITLGRNGKAENILAKEEHLRSAGISLYRTDRGGDVTYHGPGQLIGYPILDLRDWKRDVGAYLRALEQVIIDALQKFEVTAGRVEGLTGAWTCESGKARSSGGAFERHGGPAKIAAIGVHLSRWITRHGFALNISTDLRYFQYIIPCGLAGKPVTSMERVLGSVPRHNMVVSSIVRDFGLIFELEMRQIEFSTLSDMLSNESDLAGSSASVQSTPPMESAIAAC